jgi:hypothetical protein
MSTADIGESELGARLRRLAAGSADLSPDFDYQGLLGRHDRRKARARRRLAWARGAAGALVVAIMGLSAWRMEPSDVIVAQPAREAEPMPSAPEPRLVRADTYLALAALEEHIATIDDALTDARSMEPRGVEVARLERTRAELMDSYSRVRYAERVAANF